uniref:Ig-like domain-containing protein n=1 Tax=Chelonoidis abingdonii TaxID=106734 RepID=A0A8C0IMX5_CHEAB
PPALLLAVLLPLALPWASPDYAYVQKGQDRVFPCGLVEPLSGGEEVTWSYNTGVPGSPSVLLFQGVAGQALKKEVARERLSTFPNHSLYLWGAEDGDMGTYWCSVQRVTRHTYQLNVVTGGSRLAPPRGDRPLPHSPPP